MKLSEYKSYDDLPLFLNVAMVAKVLGVAPSSAYELMHEADFPVLKIGNRIVVPKEKFIQWVEQHTPSIPICSAVPTGKRASAGPATKRLAKRWA